MRFSFTHSLQSRVSASLPFAFVQQTLLSFSMFFYADLECTLLTFQPDLHVPLPTWLRCLRAHLCHIHVSHKPYLLSNLVLSRTLHAYLTSSSYSPICPQTWQNRIFPRESSLTIPSEYFIFKYAAYKVPTREKRRGEKDGNRHDGMTKKRGGNVSSVAPTLNRDAQVQGRVIMVSRREESVR